MAKTITGAIDLSEQDAKLRSILDRRESLLKSLSGPIRQAQQAFARFGKTGTNAHSYESVDATELPRLTADFEKSLSTYGELERQLVAIRDNRSNPDGSDQMARFVAQHSTLTQLRQNRLNNDALSRWAPEGSYAVLEKLVDKIAVEDRARRELNRSLSGWWERVIADGIRSMFDRPTKADDLAETLKELEKLERKRKKVDNTIRQLAKVELDKSIKTAVAAIEWLRTELAEADRKLEEQEKILKFCRHDQFAAMEDHGNRLRHCLQKSYAEAANDLNKNTENVLCHLKSMPDAVLRPWEASEWDSWPPIDEKGKPCLEPEISQFIRLGEIREQLGDRLAKWFEGDALHSLKSQVVKAVSIPVFVPFIGQGRTLIVSCDANTREDGLLIVQSLILRVAAMLGRQANFTLLDPSGHGQSFPNQRFLQARASADDVNADLKAIQQDIRRVNQNVLSGEAGLHELDRKQLASEPFELVVAAGFPDGYDRRAVETLYNLGAVGPRAGRYLILHHDTSETLPREHPIADVKNAATINVRKPFSSPADFRFHLDTPPPMPQQQVLLQRIEEAGKIDHSLDWDDVIRPEKASDWWAGSSVTQIATPIGMRGTKDKTTLWLGQNVGGQVCAHGVLAGMTGSGKSTLYHVLILGLATRYSPAELQLHLIDLKRGVEFLPYARLPHATVLSLNSPPELTLSILSELEREMDRRNELFKGVGVTDYTAYRERGHSLPRILLLIDEYQILFTADDRLAETASSVLLRLAQQGRSSGLHMFLGSQGFGAPGMLNQTAIFANFHLRVAMKLQPATVAGLIEFGPASKKAIREITMAGKFVLNDSGQDEKSIGGQAAFLKPDRRDDLIDELQRRAGGAGTCPVVFDGDAPSNVFENLALNGILDSRAPLGPKGLEAIARTDEGTECGFGQPRWVAGDRPLGLWIGRRFNVHGHAMALLVRSVQQNLLIVGSPADARAGMLAGLLVSLAALCRPTELAVDILHAGGDDDDPSLLACASLADRLLKPAGYDVNFSRDTTRSETLLVQYDGELTTRKEKGSRDAPSRLFVLIDPDRVPCLRRAGDVARPTANQERFRRLLTEGSQHGLHVVMAVSAFSLLNLVVDKRKDLTNFAHRAGLQMSQNDSYDMFGNYKATTLQTDGAKVPVALYLNTETNDAVRFKPYSVPDPSTTARYAIVIARALAAASGESP